MKHTNLRAFQKHIEGASKTQFSSLYLIVSETGSENKMAIDKLAEAIAGKEGIEPLGIRHLTGSTLKQELGSLSFFASKEIFIVHDAHELDKDAQNIILASKGNYLILSGQSSTQAFFKKVEKEGVVLELGGEKSWEKEKSAAEWLMGAAPFEAPAAQWLARESGGDLSLLEQEVEKLIAYTHGRAKITLQDVKAVAIKNRVESTFSLSDALFKRDVPEAVRLFRSLLESGNSFFALVKQLRTQVQNQLSIACILKNGGGPQEVAAHFPYMKGFILDKNIETARAFGFDRFKRALLLIDDFELDAKNGTTDYELLADLLTLKITS